MGPIFENTLIDALSSVEMILVIIGNSRIQDMMMTTFNDTYGIDLDVTEMLNYPGSSGWTFSEKISLMKSLS